ncbi:YHS domain-containing (seleno)protein [Microcoleus sp. herbarium19]|uniref:YHS domain-containing (seleno)protein n=1 Tax=unclassified Microcoleus TaxID=2642155 RepID=UPI002FD62B2D
MKISYFTPFFAVSLISLGLAAGCGNSGSNTATPNTEATAPATPTAVKNETAAKPSPSAAQAKPLPQVFYSEGGIAIRGTDPVAYFTQGKPVKGNPEFAHKWGNTTWQFASAQNRDLFAQNPEKYAPQYGGFCAWAVSQGYTASTDPDAWKIVGDKLYLNYNSAVQWGWEKDVSGNVVKGDKNWPALAKDKK